MVDCFNANREQKTQHFYSMMQEIRAICGVKDDKPTWVFDDATFEIMGALISENFCRLLGF